MPSLRREALPRAVARWDPAALPGVCSEDSMEDEDPVVCEVPVFVNGGSSHMMLVLQHTLRPKAVPYDHASVLQARMKPRSQQVELEVGLATQSVHFDRSKAELIARGADAAAAKEERCFPSGVMDKQVLSGSASVSDSSRYAVGVLSGGELHLTPLDGVVQLRPTFSHLDKGDPRAKEDLSGAAAGEAEEGEEEEKVRVKFSREESDHKKAARERSFSFLHQRSAEEPWFQLSFRHQHQDLLCLSREVAVDTQASPEHYLDQLLGSTSRSSTRAEDADHATTSSSSQKWVAPVKKILLSAKVVRFEELLRLVRCSDKEVQGVLSAVQLAARLVQGNWVVRSELLYPQDTFSSHHSVAAEDMCRARDYILYQFSQCSLVKFTEIKAVTKLPYDEVKEILEPIGKVVRGEGWEFALPMDQSFINRYPEIVERQKNYWDMKKQQQLSKALKEVGGAKVGGSLSLLVKQERRRQRTSRSARDSFSSDGESGAEGTEGGGRRSGRAKGRSSEPAVDP